MFQLGKKHEQARQFIKEQLCMANEYIFETKKFMLK